MYELLHAVLHHYCRAHALAANEAAYAGQDPPTTPVVQMHSSLALTFWLLFRTRTPQEARAWRRAGNYVPLSGVPAYGYNEVLHGRVPLAVVESWRRRCAVLVGDLSIEAITQACENDRDLRASGLMCREFVDCATARLAGYRQTITQPSDTYTFGCATWHSTLATLVAVTLLRACQQRSDTPLILMEPVPVVNSILGYFVNCAPYGALLAATGAVTISDSDRRSLWQNSGRTFNALVNRVYDRCAELRASLDAPAQAAPAPMLAAELVTALTSNVIADQESDRLHVLSEVEAIINGANTNHPEFHISLALPVAQWDLVRRALRQLTFQGASPIPTIAPQPARRALSLHRATGETQ